MKMFTAIVTVFIGLISIINCVSEEECIDYLPEKACEILKELCHGKKSFDSKYAQISCKRTCGLCKQAVCVDGYPDYCANGINTPNFCTNAGNQRPCAKTCGLC